MAYENKIKQYEEKTLFLSQKEQMKTNILSSFNKKMSLIKTNCANSNSEINTSYTDAINSCSSNGTFKTDLIPEMTLSNSFIKTSNIKTLKRNLDLLIEEKEKLKILIKQWINEFQIKYNRKPTNEDKKQINHLYCNYNSYNNQIAALEEKIENINIVNAQIGNNIIQNNETNNKSKSVSPGKAHLAKILQMTKNTNNNSNSLKMTQNSFENQSFLNSHLNITVNQSFENKNSSNNENIIQENRNLKNNEKEKIKINHNKSVSLVNFETTFITEENEDQQKSIIIDNEQKYNKKLKDLEDNYKKKINEVIKVKDASLKKLQQDLIKLKTEFEKNVLILFY